MNFNKPTLKISYGSQTNGYDIRYIYVDKIIPNRIIKNKRLYKITYLDEFYHINAVHFLVSKNTINGKENVIKITLDGFHPNTLRNTANEYCLQDKDKGSLFIETFFDRMIANIHNYYLDSCIFEPPTDMLQYERMRSMYVQLNGDEYE